MNYASQRFRSACGVRLQFYKSLFQCYSYHCYFKTRLCYCLTFGQLPELSSWFTSAGTTDLEGLRTSARVDV